MLSEHLSWGATQGHILTGGGILESHSIPGRDFTEEDLPHFLLKKRIIKQTIREWLDKGRKSTEIIGTWGRPLFCGGWKESTNSDTESFNLQSPSIFIDMRIPTTRPTMELRKRGSLQACSIEDLRMLARQHCFSGYSLPGVDERGNTVFTRHHFIDWNYHPYHPRSRPNKWWVQVQGNGKDSSGYAESFKEFSTVRDQNDVPVYMERWARRAPIDGQREKYLVLRKVRTCPAELVKLGLPPQRDAILVVVGRHWCLAMDRGYAKLEEYMKAVEALRQQLGAVFVPPQAVGGGPAYVDNLLGPTAAVGSAAAVDASLRRAAAEEYLSLEGSYGVLPDMHSWAKGSEGHFVVQRSTQPWLEGSALPWHIVRVEAAAAEGGAERVKSIHCLSAACVQGPGQSGDSNCRLVGEWVALECTYSKQELLELFSSVQGAGAVKLRAKL